MAVTYDFSLIKDIIPAEFHNEVKQLIEDYSALSDEDMWNKYNLEEYWFSPEDYEEEKEEIDLIGFLIVSLLVEKDFILQLDYKETPEEHLDEIRSFWDGEEKIVSFELDNDQLYLAKIPENAECEDIFGVEIIEDLALTEKYLAGKKVKTKDDAVQPTVKAPSALKKERTIWQWKNDCKVHYPKQTIITFIALCLIFLASLFISVLLMISFDARSAVSIISYIVCVISLIALGVTGGSFKGHNTWRYIFVRDENGDVYFVDYTDHTMAKDLHYYDLIPEGYKHDPTVMHSDVAKIAGLTYYFVFFPKECKKCLNMIRDNKVDIRVADSCHKYGYKITSVPEIKKKSYYTFIRFNILKGAKEVEVENLFDNCYDGYDEMVEYLDDHFEHDDPFMREKKADKIRRLIFIGIGLILLSAAMFAINALIKIPIINLIAAFGVLVGIGFIGAFFSEKSKR